MAEELAPQIEPVLNAVKWTGGSENDFLAKIRDQSGLLTGWDQERYGFMHLGFQEYLAAREIRTRAFEDNAVLKELAGHFGESWWQEVCLLLLALDDPSLFKPFMREVLASPAFTQHSDLVELCLDDAAETSSMPFLELVTKSPGKKRELWERQLAALRVLERHYPAKVESIRKKLSNHPFEAMRQRVASSRKAKTHETIINSPDGYELVMIPGGNFTMGSPNGEKDRQKTEGPQHQVQVQSFYLGRYPVTNSQYGKFLEVNPDMQEPKYWAVREYNQPQQPVVGASWKDAQAYAQWAGLRLPTEAEWEYACRAGTTTRFYTGDEDKDLNQAGWFEGNSDSILHPVGEKAPNAFGLYDMHGNVWECVEDDWHYEYKQAPEDGSAWVNIPRSSHRGVRGGGWSYDAGVCRSAARYSAKPGLQSFRMGFRLAKSVAP
jgi:formylglycine-generating enzyme required for sulfatase activity